MKYRLFAFLALTYILCGCASKDVDRGILAGPGITIDIEPYPIGETEPGTVIWEV